MGDKVSGPQSRPFLAFQPGPLNQHRRMSSFGPAPKSSKEAVSHGHKLLEQIQAIKDTILSQKASRPTDLPPLPDGIQIIIQTDNPSPEEMRKLGLIFLEERSEGVLVTASLDPDISRLNQKAESFASEQTATGQPKSKATISPINEILSPSFEDKIGDRLKEWIDTGKLHPDQSMWVDIELGGGKTEAGEDYRAQFEEYVRQLNPPSEVDSVAAAISHSIIQDEYSLHRAWLPGKAILDLLNSGNAFWILQIDLIPQIEDETMRLRQISAGAIPPLPVIPSNAPRLVVIDSGIASGHPLFLSQDGNSIIARQMNFLPANWGGGSSTSDDVEGGHGTAVASIAAFNSLSQFILNQQPDTFPNFWIENAKILAPESMFVPNGKRDHPQLHPDQLPKLLMRQVVEFFHQPMPQSCKIFNLSVGSAPHRLRNPISNWAEELDNLSSQNDVLFIVAAGNLQINEIKSYSTNSHDYPYYLLDSRARLRNPAQAYTALSVGALAHSTDLPVNVRNTDRAIAQVNHPSPFTRTGLLGDGIVKPDIVEIGGNLAASLQQFQTLSVPVANRDFVAGDPSRLITFQAGTSLAAPKVANLAARIHAQYPDASSNLLRALIVNSAKWPDELFMLDRNRLGNTDIERTVNSLRLCGYGVPREDCAISANEYCMVYYIESEMVWSPQEDLNKSGKTYRSKVSFFRLEFDANALYALPPGLFIRTSVTLAYNPPARKTRISRYLGVELRWDLQRPTERFDEFEGRLLDVISDDENETQDGEQEETEYQLDVSQRWNWMLKPALNPRNRRRRGTVIKDWFDIHPNQLPTPLEVAVIAKVAPWMNVAQPLKQKFALVASIESLNQQIPIYDQVRVVPRIQVHG